MHISTISTCAKQIQYDESDYLIKWIEVAFYNIVLNKKISNQAKITNPVFSSDNSKSILIVFPISVKVDVPIFPFLKNLERKNDNTNRSMLQIFDHQTNNYKKKPQNTISFVFNMRNRGNKIYFDIEYRTSSEISPKQRQLM